MGSGEYTNRRINHRPRGGDGLNVRFIRPKGLDAVDHRPLVADVRQRTTSVAHPIGEIGIGSAGHGGEFAAEDGKAFDRRDVDSQLVATSRIARSEIDLNQLETGGVAVGQVRTDGIDAGSLGQKAAS